LRLSRPQSPEYCRRQAQLPLFVAVGPEMARTAE